MSRVKVAQVPAAITSDNGIATYPPAEPGSAVAERVSPRNDFHIVLSEETLDTEMNKVITDIPVHGFIQQGDPAALWDYG